MSKECFIKATNYKGLEDVTDVDNKVKEFLGKKSYCQLLHLWCPQMNLDWEIKWARGLSGVRKGNLEFFLVFQQAKWLGFSLDHCLD